MPGMDGGGEGRSLCVLVRARVCLPPSTRPPFHPPLTRSERKQAGEGEREGGQMEGGRDGGRCVAPSTVTLLHGRKSVQQQRIW